MSEHQLSIAVVIPAYRVASHVAGVIARMPPEVRHIIVVDDASPDTLQATLASQTDPRLIVLRHEVNRGVGGAMKTGIARALELDADIVVKIDGDGQMDPRLIPQFVEPIAWGDTDFTKGNRFDDLSFIRRMPVVRRVGNLALSFLVKLASGYWHAFDPSNGYIALRSHMLRRIHLDRLADRYFFEISLLCEVYFAKAVLQDIPMEPVYGDETSSLNPMRSLVDFAPRLIGRSLHRIFMSYFLRDFNVVSIFLLAGIPATAFGIAWSAYYWIQSARTHVVATTGTVVVGMLPIVLGFQLLLQALVLDVGNEPGQTIAVTAPPRRQWAFAAAWVVVVAAILAAYSDAYQNSFHFDDSHVVEDNVYIRNIGNVPLFFRDAATSSSFPTNATYRPVVTTSLAIDYWIGGGLDPRQFHLSQVAMLVLLTILVFLMLRAVFDDAGKHWWNRYAALAGAAVVAVHTTTTETMNLIHARSELLSVMGVVGSFLVYMHLPSLRRTYLFLLPMFVGALAKNQAVVFGPLFVAYLFLFEERLSLPALFQSRARPRVLAVLLKGLPVLIVCMAVLLWVESMSVAVARYGGGTPIAYLRTQLWVWLHYARLFFVPAGLTADTDWRLITPWYDTRVFVGLIFVAFVARVMWESSKVPSLAPVAFGLAWFVLALLPASSVIPLAEVANDHRVFFPYVGLSLAVAWSAACQAERWSNARPRLAPVLTGAAGALALVAIFANAAGTYERNKAWRTEETLWRDVTEKSPANGRGWMNYGLTQMAQGKYQDAKQLFERAATYTPNYSSLEVNLGIASGRLGELDVAEAHFKRALQLQPDEPSSHSFYARWLVEQGRVSDALPLLVRAVVLSPALVAARYQLMEAYARLGKTTELKALAVETLALAPGDPTAAQYLNGNGPPVAAPAAAAVVSPAAALLDTSLARYRAGDFQGSIDAARQALALKPDYAEAFNNIAAGHASLRQWDEAIKAAQEALRLKPDFPLARNNLAWAEEESRKAKRGGL